MKRKTIPDRFDSMFGLMYGLLHYESWIHDNECWGEGGELEKVILLYTCQRMEKITPINRSLIRNWFRIYSKRSSCLSWIVFRFMQRRKYKLFLILYMTENR